ncbi:MAG: DUF2490 domain-containing protein [Vicingus serpentipes]|nr:DUF2490 domain-containing protein [Vicingus serpentipes]
MNKKIIILIIILFPLFTESQVVSDAKLWTDVSIRKEVNDFEFSFEEAWRLDENFTHTDKIFTELGAEYKVIKALSLDLGYRFSKENKYEDKTYLINHRIDFGATYKYKINNIKLAVKTKLQTKSAPSDDINPTYWRNKLTISTSFRENFTPYLSYEFFYQFNDQQVINRNRLSLGTKYDFNKKSSINLFYTFENRFNTNNLQYNHIWAIGYRYQLPKSKRKKQEEQSSEDVSTK